MNTFLIILLVLAMLAALVSLIRGIVAFLQSTRMDLESGGEGATEMQLKQNKMMFARIKFQALAIVIVAVLLAVNSGAN
ncbi:MAG: twin transmembrane helix small protein [Sphingomonadaceae bacterium]|nr:twin transmembrane helix small protein [Sphingomonadaceae bacterium]